MTILVFCGVGLIDGTNKEWLQIMKMKDNEMSE